MANSLDINKMLSPAGAFATKSQSDLCVHLICDPTCDDFFIDQCLQLFTSANSSNVKLHVDVIDTVAPNTLSSASICIIIANSSKFLGDIVHLYNRIHVPCVAIFSQQQTAFVSAEQYQAQNVHSKEFHYGLHRSNIVYLRANDNGLFNFAPFSKWLVTNARDISVPFAKYFNYLKRSIANELVIAYSIDNLSFSLTNFLPYKSSFNDLTNNQYSLVLDLAIIYNQEIDDNRRKELLAVLGVAVGSKTFTKKIIPRLGWAASLAKGIVPFGVTYYLGKFALGYFEKGASLSELLEHLK